ncbi:MAG: ester cyclase [Halobacteriales archaeon]|nr:ester cyclase [Halobacteriales archaeon]
MSDTTVENERIARRVPEEIATEGKIDLVDEVYASDAVDHLPFGNDATGPDQIRESMQTYRAAFPDFEANVEDVVTEGDTVAMPVTLSGIHEGEFMGHEPTNKSFEVQNMVFNRIEDGRVAERWVQPDTLGIFVQLGLVTPPVGTSPTP